MPDGLKFYDRSALLPLKFKTVFLKQQVQPISPQPPPPLHPLFKKQIERQHSHCKKSTLVWSYFLC